MSARTGDPAAWEALYRSVQPQLMAYARHTLSNNDDAREAVSETLVRAVAGIDRLAVDAHFTAWVHGILRYVVIDMQRAWERNGGSHGHPENELDDMISLDAEPPELAIAEEEAATVRVAFAMLSAEDRELLELRVVAGLSAEEVAIALGKRSGAVRMAQSRALGKLRAALDGVRVR